jgi:hypothetical protein
MSKGRVGGRAGEGAAWGESGQVRLSVLERVGLLHGATHLALAVFFAPAITFAGTELAKSLGERGDGCLDAPRAPVLAPISPGAPDISFQERTL